jgi:uncharacterized membrane protein YhaH (DUF805 family)
MLKVLKAYFSFEGRIGRKTFLIRYAVLMFFVVALGLSDRTMFESGNPWRTTAEAASIVAFIWCIWANSVKRWHDTNRSSLYAFIMVVPMIGALLNLVLNLSLAGTPGPNRFGGTSE